MIDREPPLGHRYRLPEVFLSSMPDRGPLFVRHIGAARPASMRVGFSRHACSFVLSGRKCLHTRGSVHEVEAGQAILYRAGTEYITEDSADYVSLLMFLTPGEFGDFLRSQGIPRPDLHEEQQLAIADLDESAIARIARLAEHVATFGQASRQVRTLEAYLVLQCLFDQHGSEIFAPLLSGQQNTVDLKISEALEDTWSSRTPLSEIARRMSMSEATFYRHVKRIYAISPADWINERRMMRAWYMLVADGDRPSQVAHEVGFQSHSAFSQAFRRQFGVPPKDAGMIGLRQELTASRKRRTS